MSEGVGLLAERLREWHREKPTRSFSMRPSAFGEAEQILTLRDHGHVLGGMTVRNGERGDQLVGRFQLLLVYLEAKGGE